MICAARCNACARNWKAPSLPGGEDPVLTESIAELDGVLETFAALLRIARAEAGPVHPSGRRSVSAGHRRRRSLCPRRRGSRPALHHDHRPGPNHPAATRRLLQRMLANLLDNALAHGAGAIRVTLTPGPCVDRRGRRPWRSPRRAPSRPAPLRPSRSEPGHTRHRPGPGVGQSRRRSPWRPGFPGARPPRWRGPLGHRHSV